MPTKLVAQQGEVLFKLVNGHDSRAIHQSLAKQGTVRIADENGLVPLFRGETGNMHAIKEVPGVEVIDVMYSDTLIRQLFAFIPELVEVVHPDHDTITLNAGLYLISQVREVDPFASAGPVTRPVRD